MAADEAIFDMVGGGKSPATLRLYAWQPACLSLGYAQPYSDVDEKGIEKNGWEVVRRLTGGRAILHRDELTYAVITGPDEPRTAGDIMQSYQQLSKALLQGLSKLGLDVDVESDRKHANRGSEGPICFEIPANQEIVANGKKLIGSAQARRKDGVLQHGTLPLYGELTGITEALVYADTGERKKAGVRLLEKATTVEAALGRRVEWEQAAEAFMAGFEEVLNLRLEIGDLSNEENERVEELVREKYANLEWTKKR